MPQPMHSSSEIHAIFDPGLTSIHSLPGLTSMEIDSCELVTDGAFCRLWEHRMEIDLGETTGELMAKLKHLEIHRCPV